MPELPSKYKKSSPLSYTLGPFPTFELLLHRPQAARAVYYHPDFHDQQKLSFLCQSLHVPCACSPKALQRISQKEICYAAALFEKFPAQLDSAAPHAALVQPGDMGNLGTIQRTLLGFGIKNLALIGGGADRWNPKAIRASMGAAFQMETEEFPDFPAYLARFGSGRDVFPFMLEGGALLTPETCPRSSCYTLVFGNEATGLPPEFRQYGQPLFIAQSPDVDSLNLAVAVAVGAWIFKSKNGGILS